MSDDHDAAARDELKHGELKPILPGPGASDYERYLRTDELLALQKTPDEMVHRDERLFQTVHQSSELWLKLACFEIDEAIVLIGDDEIRRALRLLGRANHCIVIVTEALHMLERLSPWEYHEVRKALGPRQRLRLAGLPERCARALDGSGARSRHRLAASGLTLPEAYTRALEQPDMYDLAEALIEFDERVGDLARRARQDGAARDRRRRHRHAGHPRRGARRAHDAPAVSGALGRPEHADRARGRVRAGRHLH